MQRLKIAVGLLLACLFSATLAAQVYAFQNGYAPGLGSPLFPCDPCTQAGYPFGVYSPLAYLRWLARWGFSYPQTFTASLLVIMGTFLMGLLPIFSTKPVPKSSQAQAQAHWATLRELRKKGAL